jgi:hypothetical protein
MFLVRAADFRHGFQGLPPILHSACPAAGGSCSTRLSPNSAPANTAASCLVSWTDPQKSACQDKIRPAARVSRRGAPSKPRSSSALPCRRPPGRESAPSAPRSTLSVSAFASTYKNLMPALPLSYARAVLLFLQLLLAYRVTASAAALCPSGVADDRALCRKNRFHHSLWRRCFRHALDFVEPPQTGQELTCRSSPLFTLRCVVPSFPGSLSLSFRLFGRSFRLVS